MSIATKHLLGFETALCDGACGNPNTAARASRGAA